MPSAGPASSARPQADGAVPQNVAEKISQPSPSPVAKTVPVDYATLAHCVAALSEVAVPARVENVVQTSPTTLLLALRTLTGSYRLTLSFSQKYGRLSAVAADAGGRGAKRRRAKPAAASYALALTAKALLQSSALVSARVAAPFDRVARLEFAPTPAEPVSACIFLELLGNGRSNLALTDGALSIKACGRQVASRTAARALQTGLEWQPPPPPRGVHPTDPSLGESLERIAVEQPELLVGKALVRSVAGISPATAQLVCGIASERLGEVDAPVHGDLHLGSLSDSGRDVIVDAIRDWYEAHASVDRVCVRTEGSSYRLELGEVASASANAEASGRAIEHYYFGLENAEQVAKRVRKMEKALRGRVNRARARVELYARKVAECDNVGQLKRDAEFLYSYAHSWSPGDAYVVGEWALSDSGDDEPGVGNLTEHRVRMPEIDNSDVTPVDYGQQLYRRAGKLDRARGIAQQRCEEALAEVNWLEGALVSLSMVRTLDDMADLEAEVAAEVEASAAAAAAAAAVAAAKARAERDDEEDEPAARRRSVTSKKKGKKDAGKRSKPVMRGSPSGQQGGKRAAETSGVLRLATTVGGESLEILVGRNARGNESVSFDLARRNDMWLHVAGAPGSHVVVRRSDGSGADLDEDCTMAAADYAAFFSKSSSAANVPVSVLRAGEVRRAPGSPRRLGSVIMTGNSSRTVYGRPEKVREEALSALANAAMFEGSVQ